MKGETLKEIQKATGISLSTFRFYQAIGLLSLPEVKKRYKTGGVYGVYPSGTIKTIKLINKLKDEGHTLARIKDIFRNTETLKAQQPVTTFNTQSVSGRNLTITEVR